MKRMAWWLAIALVAGCAAAGGTKAPPSPWSGLTYEQVKAQAPAPLAGQGRVYFYMKDGWGSSGYGWDKHVILDKQKVAGADGGKFFFLDLPAGSHTVTSPADPAGLSFSLGEGEVKYVRAFMILRQLSYALVDEVEAEPDIRPLEFER